MALLVSTPSSCGVLHLPSPSPSSSSSHASPGFTPLVLPTRLQRAPGTRITSTWSADGREVQLLPASGDVVFGFSYKGRRGADLNLGEGKGKDVVGKRVDRVRCLGETKGKGREMVLAGEGIVRIGKISVDETGKEKTLETMGSYEAFDAECTGITSACSALGENTIVLGYANGRVLVLRGSGSTHTAVRLDLTRHVEGPISPDIRLHPADSSILILPSHSELLLIHLPSPPPRSSTEQGEIIHPGDEHVARLPCLVAGEEITHMALRGDGAQCAVVQRGGHGRVSLVSLEDPDAPKASFVTGSDVESVEYVDAHTLAIGTASGALYIQDLRDLSKPAMEVMTTEGEPIVGLSLQPIDPSRPIKSAPRQSLRSASLVHDPKRKVEEGRRSSSASVLGDGAGRANRTAVKEDLRRGVVAKGIDGKSRHSVAGTASSHRPSKADAVPQPRAVSSDRTINAPPPNPMARALSRAEAKAGQSTTVRRIPSGESVRSSRERDRTVSGTSRAETTVSNTTTRDSTALGRDVTLPSMTSDTSVVTVRANGRSTVPAVPSEVISEEDAWALAFIRSQDERDEAQWDDWAADLVRLRDGPASKEQPMTLPEVEPLERLQMDMVEVQMRAIRADRDLTTRVHTSLRSMQEQLQQALAIVAAQQQKIDDLQRQMRMMAV